MSEEMKKDVLKSSNLEVDDMDAVTGGAGDGEGSGIFPEEQIIAGGPPLLDSVAKSGLNIIPPFTDDKGGIEVG